MFFLIETCQHPTVIRVLYFAYLFWEILAVVIPIGLIVMLMIDFTKAVVINKEEEQIKSMKLVGKRIMYAVFIFATPWIVSLVMSLLDSVKVNTGGDYYSCIEIAKNVSSGVDNIEYYDKLLENEEKAASEAKKKRQNASKPKNLTSGDVYVDAAIKLLDSARGEIGASGVGNGRGGVKYGSGDYSTPWCAYFVNWNLERIEIKGVGSIKSYIEKEISMYSYGTAGGSIYTFATSKHLNFYYSKHYGGNYTPKKGDLIYFRYQKEGEAYWNKRIHEDMYSETSHIGLVDYADSNYVYTVEGNVNGDGSANRVVGTEHYSLDSDNIMGYGSWYDA